LGSWQQFLQSTQISCEFWVAPPFLPEQLAAVSKQHRRYEKDGWVVYTPRHAPDDTIAGHVAFALRYEGVDLALLHSLLSKIGGDEIEAWVRCEPVGQYSRRAWFVYEWLTDHKLQLRPTS